MRKMTDWLRGYYRMTVSGGSPQWCVNRFITEKIPIWDIVWKDEFTVSFSVYRKHAAAAVRCIEKTMCTLNSERLHGFDSRFGGLLKRRWLLGMLSLAVGCALVLPRFVWFYEVEGNCTVPTEKIIRTVQQCGAGIGTYGKKVRPHLVRQRVLTEIPELSWLTVTQSGGRVKITVRERAEPEPVPDRRRPKNVIASHSGMITNMSVLEGSSVVKKGDMVQKGQLLISGYMDLEYKYRVCGALGEIYARTWRDIYAVTPQQYGKKVYSGEEKTQFFLCIGKKRIKLSLGSGIYPTGCDKMTKENCLMLPGGLSLPLSLVKEQYRFYETESTLVPEKAAEKMLTMLATEQANETMIAGRVEKENHSLHRENGNYMVHTTLQCEEMISRTVEAEIFKGEFTHDGTSN